jgi:cyclase
MNSVRIIPVLSIIGQQLVKTLKFEKPKYLGDPINAIKIFNDKEVDELAIVDIRASKEKKEPNYRLIAEMAGESFMPIGYGGGVHSFDQAQKVFQCGIEKIIINSASSNNSALISELASHYGSQSVVVAMDYKKQFLGSTKPVFYSATKSNKVNLIDWAIALENLGAGEIILQCVDRDGTFEGYDLETLQKITSAVKIPVVACGGARGLDDFKAAITQGGASAVAAGSHFAFKNNHRDSILINYNKFK